MERVARTLEQAQKAVLSVQGDLTTLRVQLEDEADGTHNGSHVNPFYVELQDTVQEKQQTAADLLQKSAHQLFEMYRHVEARAERLTHLDEKEKQVSSAKKSLRRYLEGQTLAQEAVTEELSSAVRVEEMKVQHLEDTAAAFVASSAQRALQRRALSTWLKRAMVRVFAREQVEARRGGVDGVDIMAQRYSLQRLAEARKRKALHLWERRMHRRQLAQSQKEALEMRSSAEFFQSELAQTQKLMSNQLDEVRAHAQQTTDHKASECDLLSDEVRRLKIALEDVTNEFGDRTRTYVRQQEEAELFYKRKEEKMEASIHDLQVSLATLQSQHAQLKDESQILTSAALSHAEQSTEAVTEALLRKSDVYAGAVSDYCRRLKQYNLSLQAEVKQLRADVTLLAPLAEKVVRLENQLAEQTRLLEHERAKTATLEKAQSQSRATLVLLTDRVHTSETRQLRQAYWHQWRCCAERNLRDDTDVQVRELTRHMKEQQSAFLHQRQLAEAEYREEKERLSVELETRARERQAMEQDLERERARLSELDQQLYTANVENANMAAKLARHRQEEQTLSARLADAHMSLLDAREAQERASFMQQEAAFRSTLALREMAVVQVWSQHSAQELAQAMSVCESWQHHCATQEAAFSAAQMTARASAANALEGAELRRRTVAAFGVWRHWAERRRLAHASAAQLRETREAASATADALAAHHADAISALTAQLYSATQRHKHEVEALRSSHAQHIERLEQSLRQEQHEAMELQSRLDAQCAALRCAEESACARDAEHAACLKDAENAMGAAMQEVRADHEAVLEQSRHAHRQDLLKARLEAEAERRALVESHAEQTSAQQSAHAETVRQLQSALTGQQDEARQLGMALVEYCARSALCTWRAWAEARRRDRTDAQKQRLSSQKVDFLAVRSNLLLEARTAQQDAFVAASVAVIGTLSETTRDQYARAEAQRCTLTQAVAALTNDVEALKLARSVAEARVEQLTSTLQATNDANATLTDSLHEAQAETDALREALAAAQSALHEAEVAWHQRHGEAEVQLRKSLDFECAVWQLEKAYLCAQHCEAAQHHAALVAALRSAWQDAIAERGVSAGDVASEADVDLSSLESEDNGPAVGLDDVAPAFPRELQQWVVQLEQAAIAIQGVVAADEVSASAGDAGVISQSVARILDCLQSPPVATSDTAKSENPHSPDAAHEPASGAAASVAGPRDTAHEVTHAVDVVRAAALEALAESDRQHAAEVRELQALLEAAREAQSALRDSMEDLLSENRALAADMKQSASAPAEAEPQAPASMRASSSASSTSAASDVWGERLDQLARRYQHVLDAFHDSIQERRETFYSVNGMLLEVDTFSEELLHRFEENVKALQALQTQLHPCGRDVPIAVAHSDVASDDAHTSVDSPGPAAPLSPSVVLDADTLALPSSSAQAEPSQESHAPSRRTDEAAVVTATTSLPSQQQSQWQRSASRASTDRDQLLDRVHLLEKLLVQAKVQVAQAREMADSAAAAAAVAEVAQEDAAHQTWTERATRDIEALQLPLTEAQLIPLYVANAEAMVICMDTWRQREYEHVVASRLDEEALDARLHEAASRHSRDRQEWETKVRQLTQTIQGLQQRHAEESQRHQDALTAAEDVAKTRAEQAEARLQTVRKSYEQELSQLEAEVARVQSDLDRARATHRDALDSQKVTLDMQHAQMKQSYELQIRQLERERDHEMQRRQHAESDQQTREAAHKRALEQLQANHKRALDALEARYSRYYVEQAQEHAVSEHSRQRSRSGSAVRTPHDADMNVFLTHFATHRQARDELICESLLCKTEVLVGAATECGVSLGRCAARSEVEVEREAWETEAMQLRERLAYLEAGTTDSPKRVQFAVEGRCHSPRCASLPPPHSVSAVGWSSSPAALTTSPSSPASHRGHSEVGHAAASSRRGGSRQTERDSSAPPHHATVLRTPAQDDLRSPPVHDPQATTPIRVRGQSVDSLDLSQSMLRYSKMLSEQTDRNEERLQHASLLEAEVNDLIDRGAQLAKMAERTGLTPRRNRSK